MLQTAAMICVYLLQGIQGSIFYTLNNCTAGDIDVILHVSSVNALQKVRLASVIKLFTSEIDFENVTNRIALFLNQNLTEPFVGFNTYNKKLQLLDEMERLPYYEGKNLQIMERMLWVSVAYFNQNYIENSNRTEIIIILCETCTHLASTEYASEYLDFSNVFIISVTEFETTNWQIQKYDNIIFISSTDDLRNNQFLFMALCGQCSPGWVLNNAIEEKSLHSCYKLDFVDSLVSYNAASQHCRTLGAHTLVIETTEELDFVKEMLSLVFKNNLTILNIVHEMLLVGMCNSAAESIKLVVPLQILVNYTKELNMCFALELMIEYRSLYLTWIPINPNIEASKIIVCEFDLAFRSLTSYEINPFISFLNETSNNKFMFHKVLEKNILLFECDDGGTSIPFSFLNDGHPDCDDGQDESVNNFYGRELPCSISFVCETIGYKYDFRMSCIRKDQVCDGVIDCVNGKDESDCNECMETSLSYGTCLPSQWFYDESRRNFSFSRRDKPLDSEKLAFVDKVLSTCNTIECVHEMKLHLEIINCKMEYNIQVVADVLTHENVKENQNVWTARCVYLRGQYSSQYIGCEDNANLKNCKHFVCTLDLFKCPMSYCVPYYMINDGVIDCPNNEDEMIDELDQIYIENVFQCRSSELKIHPVHVCDGKEHCPTGDDESLCYDHCPAGFICDWGVLSVAEPDSISYADAFGDIDFNVKAINIADVDFSQFKILQINIKQFTLLRLSNCSLHDGLLNKLLNAMHIYIQDMQSIDLSHNPLHLEGINLISTRNLNLSHTKLFSFNIDSSLLDTLDLSFSTLKALKISGNESLLIEILNASNTKLESIMVENLDVTIQVLDIRNTQLTYDNILSVTLKRIPKTYALYGDNFKLCCSVFSGIDPTTTECFAPDDPISSCYGLLGDIYKRTISIACSIIGVTGNIFLISFNNLLCVNIDVRHTGFILYQTNLLVSDLLMNVYQLIISGADFYYLQSYVMYDIEWMESPLCMTAGFLATLSYVSAAFFLLLLSLDQVVLTRPAQDNIKSRLVFVVSTIAVWCIALIVSLLPLLKPDWMIYSANSMCLGLPYYVIDSTGWMFSVFVFCFFMFLSIIVFIAFLIKMKTTSVEIGSTIQSENNMYNVKNLLLISILCWFPVSVTCFISAIDKTVHPSVIGFVSVFVVPLKSAINPYTCICPLAYRKWIQFKSGN